PLLRGVGGMGSFYSPSRICGPSVALMHAAPAKTKPGKLPPKMAKLRKKFQENNDKPIFLKGGPMDNILYRLTWVLCFLGIAGDLFMWFGYILA
ncbi:hypothetical protein KR009_006264, partial [Drosophila setifemur]